MKPRVAPKALPWAGGWYVTNPNGVVPQSMAFATAPMTISKLVSAVILNPFLFSLFSFAFGSLIVAPFPPKVIHWPAADQSAEQPGPQLR